MDALTNISSDYTALRDMVMSRPLANKLALIRELEKETFFERFSALAERIRSQS